MAECPNCGAAVEEGAPVCDSCGMSLGDGLTGDEGSQDGRNGGDGQHDHAEGGHQHGGEPQQGRQPQQGQPQQGQPQGGQPRGGQPQQGRAQGGQPQGGQPRQEQPRQGQPQGGQPPQGQPRQGQPQGQAPPQGGQAPPQGGQPQQGQYRQPQQGQYRQPRDDDVVAGLSRRQVLGIGGAGVAVAAVGGFLLLGGSGGPGGTAESFMNALISGDPQGAADLLHPDAQVGQAQLATIATGLSQLDASVEGSEVTEETEDRATVEVTVAAQGQTQPVTHDMRTANGEWRVYSVQGF